MHPEAYAGFARMLEQTGIDAEYPYLGLDVGGADVNGSVRGQLPNTIWHGLDIKPAPGVQIVADAATWRPDGTLYDVVIATELFEHAERWADIIETMARALAPDTQQLLIATCASDGRPPHGARGEWGVPAGQYYGNVSPDALERRLRDFFRLVHVEYNPNPGDAYMWAQGLKDVCICGSGDPDEDAQGRNPRCRAGGVNL